MSTIILLIIFNLLLIGFLIFLGTQFYKLTFKGFAPFISSQPQVISAILSELAMKVDARVYELGCGQAGFLRAIEENYPQAKLTGVEYSFLLYLLARIQISLGKSKIKLIRRDLFKININDADVIYCYLNSRMMQKLKDKFKQECRPGTIIISYTYLIEGWKPTKVVKISERPGEEIYFYTI